MHARAISIDTNEMLNYLILNPKPLKLGRSFVLLWFGFSWCYIYFLRHKEKGTSPWSTAPYTWHEFRGFMWGFLHSLDMLTPGLDLHSLVDPYLKKKASRYEFHDQSETVINIHRLQQVMGWYLLALFFIMFGKIWIR